MDFIKNDFDIDLVELRNFYQAYITDIEGEQKFCKAVVNFLDYILENQEEKKRSCCLVSLKDELFIYALGLTLFMQQHKAKLLLNYQFSNQQEEELFLNTLTYKTIRFLETFPFSSVGKLIENISDWVCDKGKNEDLIIAIQNNQFQFTKNNLNIYQISNNYINNQVFSRTPPNEKQKTKQGKKRNITHIKDVFHSKKEFKGVIKILKDQNMFVKGIWRGLSSGKPIKKEAMILRTVLFERGYYKLSYNASLFGRLWAECLNIDCKKSTWEATSGQVFDVFTKDYLRIFPDSEFKTS